MVTKITGQPNFKTFKKLQKQIKRNEASVTSSLGGGLHGQLGLVIPTSKYNIISGCNFIRPVHPRQLKIPENSVLHNAIRIREEHHEKLKHFHETPTIENVLKSQIIKSIESVYINEPINPSTESILHDIPKMLTLLFD